MKILIAIIAALFAGAGHAAAANINPQALAAFDAGRYDETETLAVAEDDAVHLALAARALNAKAYLEADDKAAKRLLKRAQKLAEEAAERDPALADAWLQGAVAMGQRASRLSAMRAFMSGLGGGSREKLDTALELDPENPWVLSTSGGWHFAVATRAGEGRFGSDSSVGLEHYRGARTFAPENVAIAYEMARRILTHGEPDWRDEALSVLEVAATAAPANAFDEALQTRALELKQAIASGAEAEKAFLDAQP
ncbi:MAG: hypothetical protein AAFW81_07475 [Pseudomonadota bacterium]